MDQNIDDHIDSLHQLKNSPIKDPVQRTKKTYDDATKALNPDTGYRSLSDYYPSTIERKRKERDAASDAYSAAKKQRSGY